MEEFLYNFLSTTSDYTFQKGISPSGKSNFFSYFAEDPTSSYCISD